MPVPIDMKILNAVRTLAVTSLAGHVTDARVFVRSELEWSKRDEAPAAIVAPTPGRSVSESRTAGKRSTTYPVTVIVVAPKVTSALAEDDWRISWAASFGAPLAGKLRPLPGLTEQHHTRLDSAVQLDTAAYEAAGLWRATVSINVTIRESLYQ